MTNSVNKFGVMIDCSRNAVFKVEEIIKFISILSKWGYSSIQLYTEDTLKIENEPYFGYLRGGYSQGEIKQIIDFADSVNIEVIPCIQTLAHYNCLANLPKYSSIIDIDDILLVDDEKVYSFLDKIFANARKLFKSNRINIGMDEAAHLGLGKHLKRFGYQDNVSIMGRHLKKVYSIAKKYSFEPMMWSDMIFDVSEDGAQYVVRKNIPEIPKDISLIYWDYYHTEKAHYKKMIDIHNSYGRNLAFAGGAWTWTGFLPNNCDAIKTFEPALEVCKENGVKEAFLTLWGDDGAECSLFSALPSVCYFACLCKGITDIKRIKDIFFETLGYDFDSFMLLDKANKIGNNTELFQNPTKYMLYNDPFLGIFDCTFEKDDAIIIRNVSRKLKEYIDCGEYSYIFKSAYDLCRVLELKMDLGIRTRNAYENKNNLELKKIILDYNKVIKRIENFISSFILCWQNEKKNFGLEVHEARLYGLLGRLKECKNYLIKYLNGEIVKIDELEEKILDYNGNIGDKNHKIVFNDYKLNITTGRY